MAKNLVIVESPAKAKTIEKYLGGSYKVLASVGHIRDLPRSDFAVEASSDDVSLRYEVPKGSSKVVTSIRRAAKDAEQVFLATDLDRKQFDYEVIVRPGVGQMLPVLGAVAGGPGGAAAGLALQGLLQRQLGDAAEARYALTGPWDDPHVERLPAEGTASERDVAEVTTSREGFR